MYQRIQMKAVFLSDTHNFHMDVDVPDGDILFHTGDLTMSGTLSELMDFKDWFESLPHTHKVLIAGNHDKCLGEDGILGMKMFTGCHYLNNSGVTIEGRKIWGSPMTPGFNGMRAGLSFYTNGDKEAKNIWSSLPKDLDVLLTHGPPWGILDEVKRYQFEESSDYQGDDISFIENCGDKMLLSKVIKRQPKIHAFGHIHEGYGVFEKSRNPPYDNTLFMNCSVVNERYNVVNEPIEVNI